MKDLLSLDKDENKKLRIFEDNARKGSVVIQGIEEVLVKNAQDVIHILQRGSNKRQVGSTKMNETSRFDILFDFYKFLCTVDHIQSFQLLFILKKQHQTVKSY